MSQQLPSLHCHAPLYQSSVEVLWYMQQVISWWQEVANSSNPDTKKQVGLWVQTSEQKLQFIVTSDCKQECFKTFCNICNNKQLSVRLCYVALLKPGQLSYRFMYFLFDTEWT